jgi:hypothetical protein
MELADDNILETEGILLKPCCHVFMLIVCPKQIISLYYIFYQRAAQIYRMHVDYYFNLIPVGYVRGSIS